MNELNFIFVWLAGWLVLSNMANFMVIENVSGKNVRCWSKGAAFLVFLPIFLVACLGTPRGDTWLYISNFNNYPTDWGSLFQKLRSLESGYSFDVFQFAVKRIFGNNVTAFRVLMALIHSIPMVIVCIKYSENYLMTIFLFVASACHVGWMMNGLRQFMAVTIIFSSTPLLLKKKYLPLLLTIVLAMSFHVSAVIMLPVVFIVQGKAWNEKTVFYIMLAIGAMFIFDRYTSVMDIMLQGTEFENAVKDWQAMGDDGTNPVRVFVNAIPMLLAFLGRNHIRQEQDNILNVCVNMSIITTGLYLVSMVTSGVMIGRLPIYTSLYSLILLPNLIPKMFTESSARMVRLLMVGFYMLYYMVEVGF